MFRFQKTLIPPTDLSDFNVCIRLWGQFAAALGSLLVYEGDFGVTLGAFWGHLGSLWAYRHRAAHVMQVSCVHVRAWWCGKLRMCSLLTAARSKFVMGQGGHGDSTEELESAEPDQPGVPLRSLWNHFRYKSVDLESLCSVLKKRSFFQQI